MKQVSPVLGPSRIVQWSFLACFVGVLLRATWLHMTPISHQKLEWLSDNQYVAQVQIPPYRGQIRDRRSFPLALSVRTHSIAVNPRVFAPSSEQREQLARLLELKSQKLRQIQRHKSYFKWLKRRCTPEEVRRVRQLGLKGVHFVAEPSRYYPLGKAAAQLVGFVGVDQKGLLGLEYQLEQKLAGRAARLLQLRDARGRQILLKPSSAAPEVSGDSVILTIDQVLQKISYRALSEGVRSAQAKRGFALTLDPHTGQILAMVGVPAFDPQNSQTITAYNQANMAATYRFEPGSTVKPIVVAAALERHRVVRHQMLECGDKGRYLVHPPRQYIHDDHPYEQLSVEEVLHKSSNICTYKIAQELGKEHLYQAYLSYGLGGGGHEVEGTGMVKGALRRWEDWKPLQFATISFGQGFMTTGLEMVTAYAVFANGGRRVEPYLLSRVESATGKILKENRPRLGKRLLSHENARSMREILQGAVEHGTGGQARSLRYTTAGKTGTAEIFDLEKGRYSKQRRNASFIGLGPVSEPHLVVFVLIEEPRRKPYYGGRWAAPVFRRIVEESLDYLHVKPDRRSLTI
ncbi:MAG: penicillin-binding protein 2 [Zetaproteobacteria bacterium]|nr:penicillin-binding protein 2 [Zetaproteobacteria bacterium]